MGMTTPPFTALVRELPATVPFLAPDALQRSSGRALHLRLGANESPFGVSPSAREAMLSAMERAAWYADPESYELRTELARVHVIGIGHLVIGSGIDDLLGLVVRTYVERGDRVVTSLGAYPTFSYHVAGYGGELHRVPYRDGCNDLQALAETAHRVGAKMVYLANPDNPTGTWHTAGALSDFLCALPPRCLLVLDEAYAEFAPEGVILPMCAEDERIIRMRTFSKAHGMAGLRIGYAIAAKETIRAFDKIRLHFGVNLIAQAGALASLRDPDFVKGVVREVAEGREDYHRMAAEFGLASLPSATNFVAVDLGTPQRAKAMVDHLLERDVFIRMPGAPPLDRYIRLSVGAPEERAAFRPIFREMLDTLPF
ncbi:MAG: aminotransferase class I/II-fold pyridoxal phosphate-dependent enzyme [Tumebacillaceae bacterium]